MTLGQVILIRKMCQNLTAAVVLTVLIAGNANAVVTDSLLTWYDARDTSLNGVDRGTGQTWNDRRAGHSDATVYGDAGFASATVSAVDVSDPSIQTCVRDVFTFRTTLDDPVISAGEPGNVSAIGANKLTGGMGAFSVEYFARIDQQGSTNLVIPTNATLPAGSSAQARMWSVESRDIQNNYAPQMLIYGDVSAGNNMWNGVIAEDSAPDNTWFHYLGVFDNSQDIDPNRADDQTFGIWINGVQQATTAAPAAGGPGGRDNYTGIMNDGPGLPMIGQGVEFGNAVTQGLISGAVGFVRFYDKALSTGEIAENFGDAQTYFVPEPTAFVMCLLGTIALLSTASRRRA
jgi:hypothetical protein